MLEYLSREDGKLLLWIHPAAAVRSDHSIKPFGSFVPKEKKEDKIRNPLWLKVKSKVSEIARAVAVVHAESLDPSSHIISVQFWICHLRSETLRVRPHPPDPGTTIRATFPSLFPPVCPLLQLRLILVRVADPEAQARGGKHGFIFTAFHSRKAESLVNWYAPLYALHRPDNVSLRRNLTSSRLDPTEPRSERSARRLARLLCLLSLCPIIRETLSKYSDVLFLFFLRFMVQT